MKKNLLLLIFFLSINIFPTISWMGNHSTGSQPNNSQTIHFYVEMWDSYAGCHAEVSINCGGTWTSYTLTQGSNNGNNSTWSADVNVPSTATAYYFHGWDNWGANVYDNNGSANYSISIAPTTKAAGNWSATATWCDGAVPATDGKTVRIAHNVTLDQNATVAALVVNSGSTFTGSDNSARTLTISPTSTGTTLTVSGTWANGSGGSTVLFTGNTTGGSIVQTVSGTFSFNNATVQRSSGSNDIGLVFSGSSTANGNVTIGAGGYISTAPTYATNSTLIYNSASAIYGRYNEWNSTSGAGYPYNVKVSNNCTLNLGNGATGTAKQCAGSLTIDNGSSLTMNYTGAQMTQPLTIKGSVTINGTLELSSQTGGYLIVEKDFTNNGTFTHNNKAVNFSGSTSQSISGTGTLTFYDLTINNSNGISLSNNITISDVLTFTSGKISAGSNTVTISNNAAGAISGGSSSNYIVLSTGGLKRAHGTATGSYLFPIGTASNYRGATVNFTSAPSSATNLTAYFLASDPGCLNGYLPASLTGYWGEGYWVINSSGTPGGAYSLSLDVNGIAGVGNDTRILKRANSSTEWALAGSYGAYSSPTITHTAITGFSEFGLGGTNSLLPIELTNFSYSQNSNSIVLSWSTASEINNAMFVVLRSSDRLTWSEISSLNGAGNSNSPKYYSCADKNVAPGKWYYKLRQIDNDGSSKEFPEIEVLVARPVKFELDQNFPNPFNPSTKISYSLASASSVTLTLYNALGQKIKVLQNGIQNAGNHSVTLNASDLQSGIYFYKLEAGSYSQVRKMTVLK